MIRFFKRIKKTIQWLPVIWKQEDWDHYYILELLKYKLERMVKLWEKNKHYVGYENDVKWMKTCIRLIDKIDEDYTIEMYDEEVQINKKLYYAKYPLIYKKYKNKKSAWVYIGEENQDRAHELLFKIIGRFIQHWWE